MDSLDAARNSDHAWWWRAWLLAGAAALAGYFLVPDDRWYSNAYYDAIGLASAAAIVAGVRLHRPARPRLWYCFAAGQATWSLGDAAFGYYEYALKIAFELAFEGRLSAGRN